MTSAPLSIHVLAPGGAATGAGARVRATSQAAPGPVGHADRAVRPAARPVTLHATGTTDVEVVTDATGTAAFTGASHRRLHRHGHPRVERGRTEREHAGDHQHDGDAGDGRPHAQRDAVDEVHARAACCCRSPTARARRSRRSIRRVTAPGTVVSATVAADGTYQLFVDPGRSYELLAQPPAGSLARPRGAGFLASPTRRRRSPPRRFRSRTWCRARSPAERRRPSAARWFRRSARSRRRSAWTPRSRWRRRSRAPTARSSLMLPDPPAKLTFSGALFQVDRHDLNVVARRRVDGERVLAEERGHRLLARRRVDRQQARQRLVGLHRRAVVASGAGKSRRSCPAPSRARSTR